MVSRWLAGTLAELPSERLARGQSRDGVDHHDFVQVLVGGERARHELLELAVGHVSLRIELHRGDGQLTGTLVGDPEHRAVDNGGMSVQDRLDLCRARPGRR